MKGLIYFLFVSVLFSCQQIKRSSYSINDGVSKEIHPGKNLMETQCIICHSATANHDNRLAPPMIAVKKRYASSSTTKEEFVKSIQNWFNNPTEGNAKMYGAVKRFGVMPKLSITKENLNLISDYLYDNDIDQPEWFENHYNEEKRKGFPMHKRKQS
ncbi:hypothetical protein BWZ22_02585 [Seonamhaeicola sp. S2-3]|uniref:c-type cytochrome n=1 Tax=Seonamhaeicola sp. S2-3 TaxID=1936081 RepID=UPI0009727904|nr:c-type cytochrome [Seonamhaeicola sp. S2-3]APY10188.1 hypothetical protein BWZ22_02585 [Seonamhaeicola sp. S2-3]